MTSPNIVDVPASTSSQFDLDAKGDQSYGPIVAKNPVIQDVTNGGYMDVDFYIAQPSGTASEVDGVVSG